MKKRLKKDCPCESCQKWRAERQVNKFRKLWEAQISFNKAMGGGFKQMVAETLNVQSIPKPDAPAFKLMAGVPEPEKRAVSVGVDFGDMEVRMMAVK